MLPVEHGAVTLQTGAAIVGSFGAITEFVEIAREPKSAVPNIAEE